MVYGGTLLLFALAPGYWWGIVALLIAGGGYLAIASTLNTTIQLQVDESMRGKVLSLYLMGLTLTVPLGNLVQGWAVELIGPRVTVAMAAAVFLAAAGILSLTGRLRLMD